MKAKVTTATLAAVLALACLGFPAVLGGCDGSGRAAGSAAGANPTFVRSAIAQVADAAASEEPLAPNTSPAPEPYAYSRLGAVDRERYDIVLEAFRTREAQDYPDDDMEGLERIRDFVLADHPELFTVQSVGMNTTSNAITHIVTSVSVEGNHNKTPDEAAAVLQRAEAAVGECFAGLTRGSDDYAKAKRAYEYLAERVEYGDDGTGDAPSPDQTIEGALVNGRALCGGYANAYAYLLQSVGVQCAVVSGIGDGTEHAWCLAKLDGDYYYVDPTWGDPIGGSLSYDYLAVTTGDIGNEHVATTPVPLPRCTATADNYFAREGLLFDWADEARLASLAAAGSTQVRCADEQVYAALLDCVTSGRLANLMGITQYLYSYSDEMLTLKVWLS